MRSPDRARPYEATAVLRLEVQRLLGLPVKGARIMPYVVQLEAEGPDMKYHAMTDNALCCADHGNSESLTPKPKEDKKQRSRKSPSTCGKQARPGSIKRSLSQT